MEVLLPPSFDSRLIIPNKSLLPARTNWLPVQVQLANKVCSGECNTRNCYYLVKDDHINAQSAQNTCNSATHYSIDRPKSAIYSTIPMEMNVANVGSSYSTPNGFNDTDKLVTISIISDPLYRLPASEYCIIQNNEQYSKFMLEPYPTESDEPCVEKISEFLYQQLGDHACEHRYKIIRRKVFLIKAFGNSKVLSKKFRELLSVDCNILYYSIMKLFTELDIKIYRCNIVERPNLMNLFHSKLVKPCPNRDEELIKKVLSMTTNR